MKQLTEDYVSFETAKLLKEKGFDEYCGTAYTTTEGYPIRVMGSTYSLEKNSDYDEFHYSMPSQSLALKWLREVHNIFIEINVSIDLNGDYHYAYSILDKECKYIKRFIGYYSSHESCVEAALLYVLKNLI